MKIIHTLPLLIRKEHYEQDIWMALSCLQSLALSEQRHVVIYHQGMLNRTELESLIFQGGVTADVIGAGDNVGIVEARQACLSFIKEKYPNTPYVSEIHNDMLFPKNWYEPLLSILETTDEPIISPGILTSHGQLQPLGKHIPVPESKQALLDLLASLAATGTCEGFVHPVIHRTDLLLELGGYDISLLTGKQGYEDDSLLLSYAYHVGTKNKWRPKCSLASWVYHAYGAQRFSLPDKHEQFALNKEGLIKKYGLEGQKLLAFLHNDPSFLPPH